MKEEKELLLKVLCAMLPYEVMCKWYGDGVTGVGKLDSVCKIKTSAGFEYWDCYFEDDGDDIPIEIVKPYLRPLSSMTKEEKQESRWYRQDIISDNFLLYMNRYEEWLDSKHFDWRTDGNGKTMIEIGLALEAQEGMYNTKTE